MIELLAAGVVKVFLIAGQSNAGGTGVRIQLAPVPSWAQTPANGWTGAPTASSDAPGVQYPRPTLANFPMLYNSNNTGLMSGVVDAWGRYEGERPTGSGYAEESSYGPEVAFLWKYREAHPGQRLAAVKCVLGGSGIGEWMPPPATSSLWPILVAMIDQAKARLEAAGDTVEWAGLLWMQGENGASGTWAYLHPTAGQQYSDQLRTFLAAVRARTSPGMPVLIGRIGNHMLADNIIGTASSGENTPENRRGATNHRRAQQALVAAEPGNALVDTDGLPVQQTGDPQWWYHHTGAGYLAMGERFYAAFAGAPPPSPAPRR